VILTTLDSDSGNSVGDRRWLLLFGFLSCYGISNPKMGDNMPQIDSVKINNDLATIIMLGNDSEDRSSMSTEEFLVDFEQDLVVTHICTFEKGTHPTVLCSLRSKTMLTLKVSYGLIVQIPPPKMLP
jgi:hypothetical protein